MVVRFDVAFDSGAWPGQLAGKSAAAGEVWAGLQGLLDILETLTGLGGPGFSFTERSAALIPVLDGLQGAPFWRESFEADPLAASRCLLTLRDALYMDGWLGQDDARLPPRIRELSRLSKRVLPGLPDRLLAVCEALQVQKPELREIVRVRPVDDLPALWQTLFARLEAAGVRIVDCDLADAAASGNLASARSSGFVPEVADGSLQLLRPAGVMEAAEQTAAYLASLGDLGGTVIIGADAVLDGALRRYGLPAAGTAVDNALLRILPLVLECGRTPADPERVLELLALQAGPVPRRMAAGLARALHCWPAVGSEDWQQALQESLDAIETDAERKSVATRLERIFMPDAPAGGDYPVDKLSERIDLLVVWLQGRKLHAEDAQVPSWNAAIAQCSLLRRLLEVCGMQAVPEAQLRRLLQWASADAPVVRNGSAEAGLSHVPDPGAIGGPARRVIWWGFSRNAAGTAEQLPFTAAQVGAMKGCGVRPLAAATVAAARAIRWRRPLLQSAEALILVCPVSGPDGAEMHPHPLWDEITGSLAPGCNIDGLVRRELLMPAEMARMTPVPATPPQAIRDWVVGIPIPAREVESPSGGGCLIGCPFQWVLNYVAGLKGGITSPLPSENLLFGTLVHEIVSGVMKLPPETPALAYAAALNRFDAQAPRLAAALYLPGNEKILHKLRSITGETAKALVTMLLDQGASVLASEEAVKASGLGGVIGGTPDLVIDNPPRVIDFKWGGKASKTDALQRGAAYQLAAYGYVLSGGKEPVLPGAYYILDGQEMLTATSSAFPGARRVNGPSPDDTWAAFDAAYRQQLSTLQSTQRVLAAGVAGDGPVTTKSGIGSEGRLVLAPPCRFCDYGGLCGRLYEDAS